MLTEVSVKTIILEQQKEWMSLYKLELNLNGGVFMLVWKVFIFSGHSLFLEEELTTHTDFRAKSTIP